MINIKKELKVIITFLISFIIAYLIVGYVKNGMFVGIKWDENATLLDKLREYYVRTAFTNIIPTFIIAIIPTIYLGINIKK